MRYPTVIAKKPDAGTRACYGMTSQFDVTVSTPTSQQTVLGVWAKDAWSARTSVHLSRTMPLNGALAQYDVQPHAGLFYVPFQFGGVTIYDVNVDETGRVEVDPATYYGDALVAALVGPSRDAL
jgi:hypothetical protein